MTAVSNGMGVLIIAEVGSVHDGSFGNALHLIDAAAQAGADAVKFQTHIAEAETLKDAPTPPYFSAEPRYDYFRRTGFTRDQWRALTERCRERGIEFMSSPFSLEAVDLLEELRMARYKIPSGEVSNTPLLERVASTGKPVLLSSGMSSWEELELAVKALAGGGPVTLMQCTTEYPCPPERVGLNVMREMQYRFAAPVGYSDHSMGPEAILAAVALGACVVEKHFAFSRLMYGSDAKHSMEPQEFADMVRSVRCVETMLANPVDKTDAQRFQPLKAVFEKSVVAARDIPAGAVIGMDMLAVKKPGTGIPARRLRDVVGKRAQRDIAADTLLNQDDIAWE